MERELRIGRRAGHLRGGVSTLVLVAIIPLLLALGAMLSLSAVHHEEAQQSLGQTTAELTSFTGAQDALSRLEIAHTLNGPFDVLVNGGVAHVVASPWLGDGIDNDQNGLIDDAEEKNLYSIESEGWLNESPTGAASPGVSSYHSKTDVLAEVTDFEFSFGAAIYIDDPKAKIDLNGAAFELSGNDSNLDDSQGPELPRPAVGVNGDPSGIISQVAGNQRARIVGSLPDPAIGTTDALDYDKYLSMLSPLATVNWTGADDSYTGSIGDFQNRKGVIAHATGNLKLHGTTTGAGILIVDGDLNVSGHFQFAGLLIVRGNVNFSGGGGSKQLYGSLLLWGKDSGGQAKDDLGIDGTVQVDYSSQGLEIASTSGGVKVLFWRAQ